MRVASVASALLASAFSVGVFAAGPAMAGGCDDECYEGPRAHYSNGPSYSDYAPRPGYQTVYYKRYEPYDLPPRVYSKYDGPHYSDYRPHNHYRGYDYNGYRPYNSYRPYNGYRPYGYNNYRPYKGYGYNNHYQRPYYRSHYRPYHRPYYKPYYPSYDRYYPSYGYTHYKGGAWSQPQFVNHYYGGCGPRAVYIPYGFTWYKSKDYNC
jgi:hypothetical protein